MTLRKNGILIFRKKEKENLTSSKTFLSQADMGPYHSLTDFYYIYIFCHYEKKV